MLALARGEPPPPPVPYRMRNLMSIINGSQICRWSASYGDYTADPDMRFGFNHNTVYCIGRDRLLGWRKKLGTGQVVRNCFRTPIPVLGTRVTVRGNASTRHWREGKKSTRDAVLGIFFKWLVVGWHDEKISTFKRLLPVLWSSSILTQLQLCSPRFVEIWLTGGVEGGCASVLVNI